MTAHGYLDIGGRGYACTGDDVTNTSHVTSSKVTNGSLAITFERIEIHCRGWSYCVCLVKTLLMTCNLAHFTGRGHRVALTLGQKLICEIYAFDPLFELPEPHSLTWQQLWGEQVKK